MLISVIIPMHNEINLINGCVTSVLLNTHQDFNFEILIINDGRLSLESIQAQLPSDSGVDIKIIMNKFTKGVSGARNTGIEEAIGEYIAFLDVDDRWVENKVLTQLSVLKNGNKFCCAAYELSHNRKVVAPPSCLKRYEDVFLLGGICCSSVILSRSLIGGHRFSDVKFGQDLLFWSQILKDNFAAFVGVDTTLVYYNSLGGTRNKFVQLWYYFIILYKARLPIHYSLVSVFYYVKRGIRNHFTF